LEDLLSGLFGYFSPDLKIEVVKGKFFQADSIKIAQIRAISGVSAASQTVEEIAFFEYQGSQDFGTIKGVDDQYLAVTRLDSTILEGKYLLKKGENAFAILGAGMRNKLSANVDDPFSTMTVYMPKKEETGALDKPFVSLPLAPAGTFSVQQDFDNEYVITDLGFVRELLSNDSLLSSIEIRVQKGTSPDELKPKIQAILGGENFKINNKNEQNAAFLKLMRLEKWMSFAILSLTLFLMAFNMVGALWMLVLDKQKDLATLKSLGATDAMLRQIFLLEGALLSLFGMAIGFGLAFLIYFLQKQYELVQVPEGFLVRALPIQLRVTDFLPIALVVLGIGFLASLPAANRAANVASYLRED
jgi:lipoprotein-releasing system permease protein